MGMKEELVQIVGEESVITDSESLESFGADLSSVPGEAPDFIVKPRNLDDVQKVIILANEKGFSLVPCSSQGERFKGDTVPAVLGAVIVDLSEMKSIIRVDKRNKVAMVEPGVTFGELQDAAGKEGLRLEMPLAPRSTKSVVASLLDREPTTGPKYNWDAIDPLCCLELIFGTGEMFRTGNAAGPGTIEEQWAAGQAQKMPMGPAQMDIARLIQGSQGTLGIATWATIKLELMPTLKKAFFIAGDDLNKLMDFAYKILWRKIPDMCLILNGVNLAAICGKGSANMTSWVLVYSISGLEHFPEERINYMEKDLAEIAETCGVTPTQNVGGISADRAVDVIGKPSDEPFWKLRPKGACHDLFFLTTLDRTPQFIKAVNDKAAEHDYPTKNVGVYIQPIRHGSGCHIEFNLMYDAKNSEETQKVQALFDSASRTCVEMGGFFSRPYGPWAKMAYEKCPDTVSALRKVKNIFDPNGILNPGKLCFETGA